MNTLFIGQSILRLESVDSTNSYALDLMRNSEISEGLVIQTYQQTAGRGQRGNHWESEPGKNLTLSVVLFPSFLSANEQFMLNKVIAIGVAEFIAFKLKQDKKDDNVKVKWPNDIYVGKKKIAGILIENSLKNNDLMSSVIGIGINVNQIEFSGDSPNPVSLQMLTKRIYELDRTLEELCSFIEARYIQLKGLSFSAIDKSYLDMLYLYNEWTSFIVKEEPINAKIIGVLKEGKLILETDKQKTEQVGFNEIKFIL